MNMDLRMIIVGYDQPTLWISVGVVTVVAIAAGVSVGMGIVRLRPRIARWVAGLWLGILLAGAATIIAEVVFSVLFWRATGAQACTPVVRRVFLVPGVAAVVSEATAWWLRARRMDHSVTRR
jgi:hypothetical protein